MKKHGRADGTKKTKILTGEKKNEVEEYKKVKGRAEFFGFRDIPLGGGRAGKRKKKKKRA